MVFSQETLVVGRVVVIETDLVAPAEPFLEVLVGAIMCNWIHIPGISSRQRALCLILSSSRVARAGSASAIRFFNGYPSDRSVGHFVIACMGYGLVAV